MSPHPLSVRVARVALPVVVLALGGLAASWLVDRSTVPKERPRQAPMRLVRVHTARKQPSTLTVTTDGTVRPKTVSTLVARVSGEIVHVASSIANGGFFDKNDLLFEIDRRDYDIEVVRARAVVARAERALATEKQEARLAIAEWKRVMKDVVPDPLAAHKPQLDEALANRAAANAELAKAELDLSRTQVLAPYAGRVSKKLADLGQAVVQGTPLTLIHDTDSAEVRLPIADAQLAFLDLPDRLGHATARDLAPRAQLSARFAGKDIEWKGRVSRIEDEVDPRTQMVHLIIDVLDPYARQSDTPRPPLPFGLFVEARIQGRRIPGVVELPRRALRGAGHVWVIDESNRLRERPVKILRTERDHVLISAGVSDGEHVCISAIETFIDGMSVQIAPEPRSR
ncbi:MAG: efflux transporter periplasmic adaptor subunit [Planctomycetes bacterium]|nr:efflux transporter periplasmic adaptor subunit [Planctomycetota bacterium]